jgi:hypothetical protein
MEDAAMRLLSTVLLATMLLCGTWVTAGAGEEKPPPADIILELMDKVRNGLIDEKVEALTQLGKITNRERLDQFKVPAFLVGVVKSLEYAPKVRVAAVAALGNVMKFLPDSKEGALGALTERLVRSDDATAVRRAIAEAMGGFLSAESPSDRPTFNVLVKIATERRDDAPVVAAAMEALGKARYLPALNTAIVPGINDADSDVRAAALRALEQMFSGRGPTKPSDDVIRILIALISDDKAPLASREAAMRALVSAINTGAVKGPDVAYKLADILEKATDAKLAAAVVDALTRVPEEASVAALKKAYEAFQKPPPPGQDFAEVRVAVVKAIGEYFHPLARKGQTPTGQAAAEMLIKVCRSDPSPKVVTAAVAALGNMVDSKYDRKLVVQELIETMASDADKGVALAAHEALKFITQRDVAPGARDTKEAAKEWKKWFEANKEKLAPGM